jgi:plasmid replication initiation protein
MTGNNSTVSAKLEKTKRATKPRAKREKAVETKPTPPAENLDVSHTDDEHDPRQLSLLEPFSPEIVNWPLKDDLASMEVPLFSLSKGRDVETRDYVRGKTRIKVTPSAAYGAANVFDKDLLLYISSHIVARMNDKKPVSRKMKIDSFDFLKGTGRSDGGASFENILGMLRRLKGTNIETNIETGGELQTSGFSLIDTYDVLSQKKRFVKNKATGAVDEKTTVLSFTVTISEWLWNGLSKPVQRRLYEVARKHCGTDKAMWKINIDLLAEKIGFKRDRANFRSDLRAIIQADSLPQYRMALDTSAKPEMVVFFSKDVARFNRWLSSERCFDWYNALEQFPETRAVAA